jgi:hypothetical protein
MILSEAIAKMREWPRHATLFAERINGEFRTDSEAVVLEVEDDESPRPVTEVAAQHAPGKHYFLEVFVALDVLDGWRYNHRGEDPTMEEAVEAIIHYAEYDAYPESFFGDQKHL